MANRRLCSAGLALVLITTGCGSNGGSAQQDPGPVVGTPTKAQVVAFLKRDFAAYNDRQWATLEANACPSSKRSSQVRAIETKDDVHFTYALDSLTLTSEIGSLGSDKYEVKFNIDYKRKKSNGTEKTGTMNDDAKLAKNGNALCLEEYA